MEKLLLVIVLLFASTNLSLAGDAAVGKNKSITCVACHGANGISLIPNYPNLAGQKEAYLAAQMQAYKNGERKNAAMSPMAMPLSEIDIADLAAYFSSLSACPQ